MVQLFRKQRQGGLQSHQMTRCDEFGRRSARRRHPADAGHLNERTATVKKLLHPLLALLALAGPAPAYIDRPPTLGRLVQYDAADIAVVRVEKVSREKGGIVYKKVADLKGKYPTDQVRQVVGRRIADAPAPGDDPRPRGAHSILDWAEPGTQAVVFHDRNSKIAALCVGRFWYLSTGGKDGLRTVNEFEERALSWAYAGPVDQLPGHVAAILAGKEVV